MINFSPSGARGKLSACAQVEQCLSVCVSVPYRKHIRRTLEGVTDVSKQDCTCMLIDFKHGNAYACTDMVA